MTLSQAWAEMQKWMEGYVGEHPFMLIFAVDSLIFLLIANKSIRKSIIIPLLCMVPIVINPVLYKYIYRTQRYWRFFWIRFKKQRTS